MPCDYPGALQVATEESFAVEEHVLLELLGFAKAIQVGVKVGFGGFGEEGEENIGVTDGSVDECPLAGHACWMEIFSRAFAGVEVVLEGLGLF